MGRQEAVDRRLLGTWVSDRRRTMLGLKGRGRMSVKAARRIGSVFGKLRIRVTPKRRYSMIDGATHVLGYRVVASNSQGVVVIGRTVRDEPIADADVQHIRFVTPDVYWVCAWGIHEYFRRVKTAEKSGLRR